MTALLLARTSRLLVSPAGTVLRRSGGAVLVGGLALLLAGCGNGAADTSTGAPSPSASAAAPGVSPQPSYTGAPEHLPSSLATAPAKLGDLQKVAATRPVAVQVPGYDPIAPVHESTADPVSGGLTLSNDPADVSWWSAGALPGEGAGNVVLASHISYNGHYGPFTRLTSLVMGQTVRLKTASGRWLDYRIQSRRQFIKHVLPRQNLFSQTGPPRLLLITCGGSYDPDTRNYADNVVVTAVPVS